MWLAKVRLYCSKMFMKLEYPEFIECRFFVIKDCLTIESLPLLFR